MAIGGGTMTVYIEYAFLENVLLDACLLLFALRYSGCRATWRVPVAAIFGGVVALICPLISLPTVYLTAYKLCTGVTLPLLAVGRENRRKTTLCVLLFFAFSFVVAGGTFAFASFLPIKGGYVLKGVPVSLLSALFFCVFAFLGQTLKKWRRRREKTDCFVDCAIEGKAGEVELKGFVDTGNHARHFGLPICFVLPSVFEQICEGKKQSKASIVTVAGTKEITLVKLKKLRITQGGQTHIINGVYLSPSVALCAREYDLLLGAWAWR